MRDDEQRAAHTDPAGVLSPREHEIAEMIARGQSNQGIADNLVVSVKTVESHVQHIFRKLTVKRRAEIATWIVRHELLDNPHLAGPAGVRARLRTTRRADSGQTSTRVADARSARGTVDRAAHARALVQRALTSVCFIRDLIAWPLLPLP